MNKLPTCFFAMVLLGSLVMPMSINAQEKPKPPTKSQEQEMNQRNTVPKNFTTEIIAVDEEGRARAQQLIEIYKVLATNPTVENLRKYIRDDYVQHSAMLPDGPNGLSGYFSALVAQYPVAIDVHKVMVVGDWAMAHVNFRNLDTTAPDDLGMTAVDIYTFGPDGKLAEHWDAVQSVPSYSVNPHGVFIKVRKD